MVITTWAYYKIVKTCPDVPPETGGIIGGQDGIINTFIFDRQEDNCQYNSYQPNVGYLNEIIQHWADSGVEFYGLFHSHTPGNNTLSMPDKGYMQSIMETMPIEKSKLYFPLVFPKWKMSCYLATKNGNEIIIEEDMITFADAKVSI